MDAVSALTEAILNRWREAQLDPCLGDEVKAGLAALEFLDTVLDRESPWDLRDHSADAEHDAADIELLDTTVWPNESNPS